MRKGLVFLVLLAYVSAIYAQDFRPELRLDMYEIKELSGDFRMNFPNLKNELTFKESPKTLNIPDFSSLKVQSHAFQPNFHTTLYRKTDVLPGLAITDRIGFNMSYRFGESFHLNTGIYTMKSNYNFGLDTYYGGVIYSDASYRLFPWLTVGLYGQYNAAYAGRNALNINGASFPAVNTTAFWNVYATAMLNKYVGLQGYYGQQKESRKWETIYGVRPVFNLNSLLFK
jgi:hypothetical protein